MSATLGVTRTMKSTIPGEDRKVFIRLPPGYDTSGNAYPVLYLLDGTPAFLLEMIAITTRLRNDRNAPELIIVAIENINRNRDMMPVVVAKDYPGPPRPEAFLGFLEKELIRGPAGTTEMMRHLQEAFALDIHVRRDLDGKVSAKGIEVIARDISNRA